MDLGKYRNDFRDYKKNLTKFVNENGYWSKQVFDLNNSVIDKWGYNIYQKWQSTILNNNKTLKKK